MCGIAGFQGSFARELLPRMAGAIAHRGPDDHGYWHDETGRVALAHRRLSIIDLSPTGHQPMLDPDARAAIVFNGEVYNYRELRDELVAQGVRFRGTSDTEVLLHLWLRDGDAMLRRLNGIFAFAIWDQRKRQLLLARDQLGVKPLYWAADPRGVLFASEIKALLQDEGLSRALDPRAVRDHLTYLHCPGERTMLAAVRRLLPGEAMVVEDGRVARRWRFYRLPEGPVERGLTFEHAATLVHDTVRAAVHRQMVGDVRVGAFLSGGLDSSSVVAFARETLPAGAKLPCFTIAFDDTAGLDGFADDLPFARSVARHLGVELHELRIDSSLANRLPQMLWHLDEPLADPAALNTLLISELARATGIKVLLAGVGGDDVFTGYRRHYALAQERAWAWLPRFARRALRAAGSALPRSRPAFRRVAKAFAYADRSPDERISGYFCWADPESVAALLAPGLREEVGGEPFCASIAAALAKAPAGASPLQKILRLELSQFLPDHNLLYGDKLSMAAGVEMRVPLLDLEVVDLAARIPDEHKQRGRIGKAVFKKAMEGILPDEVIYRPKTGFGAPVRQWVRGELHELLADTLSEPVVARRGLFAPAAVAGLVRDNASGRVDGAYTILGLACIELWCRMFVDRVPAVG
jgi:asparagine synthase (glutamine-hydrolysing)